MKINPNSYNWEKFYSIRDFNSKDFWKTKSAADPWSIKDAMTKGYPSGVYIYGFIDKINGKNLFAPYYVGKSRNIFDRIFNHIAGLRGCSLAIYKRNEIFSVNKDFNTSKPLNYGSLSFFKNFLEGEQSELGLKISKEIDWMMKHFVVTWTIELDPKKRIVLEKEIGKIFNSKYLITKIGTPQENSSTPDQIKIEVIDDLLEINRKNKWFVDDLKCNNTIKKIIAGQHEKPYYNVELVDCHQEAQKILSGSQIV